jgi:MFS family permease
LLGAFCAVICYIANKKYPNLEDCEINGAASGKIGIWLVLGLALLSVVIRSFGGTAIPMEWKTTMKLGLVSGFAAFFGKFIGGFAADIFGARRTGIITLLASLPLLIFGSGNMIVSVIGIILFNMTMPITLGICAERLPKNPGIAFGLTTAALLLGAVPSFFAVITGKIFLLVPAVLVSAACIYFSAENKKSSEVHEK